MNKTVLYISDRLKERSTWLGLLAVASTLGYNISPELQEAIITIGGTLGGLICILTRGN